MSSITLINMYDCVIHISICISCRDHGYFLVCLTVVMEDLRDTTLIKERFIFAHGFLGC